MFVLLVTSFDHDDLRLLSLGSSPCFALFFS